MRKINLENDFGTTEEQIKANPKFPSNKTLTVNWIFRTIDSSFAKIGLTSDKRRIYARIITKAEAAAKNPDSPFLDINEYEYKFIVDAFNTAVVAPSESKFIDLVETAILAAPALPDIDASK